LERQNQIAQLFGAMERLADVDLAPLTETEIEAEVSAARLIVSIWNGGGG